MSTQATPVTVGAQRVQLGPGLAPSHGNVHAISAVLQATETHVSKRSETTTPGWAEAV